MPLTKAQTEWANSRSLDYPRVLNVLKKFSCIPFFSIDKNVISSWSQLMKIPSSQLEAPGFPWIKNETRRIFSCWGNTDYSFAASDHWSWISPQNPFGNVIYPLSLVSCQRQAPWPLLFDGWITLSSGEISTVNNIFSFLNTYLLDSDLSDGKCYPMFEQPGPEQYVRHLPFSEGLTIGWNK